MYSWNTAWVYGKDVSVSISYLTPVLSSNKGFINNIAAVVFETAIVWIEIFRI